MNDRISEIETLLGAQDRMIEELRAELDSTKADLSSYMLTCEKLQAKSFKNRLKNVLNKVVKWLD